MNTIWDLLFMIVAIALVIVIGIVLYEPIDMDKFARALYPDRFEKEEQEDNEEEKTDDISESMSDNGIMGEDIGMGMGENIGEDVNDDISDNFGEMHDEETGGDESSEADSFVEGDSYESESGEYPVDSYNGGADSGSSTKLFQTFSKEAGTIR